MRAFEFSSFGLENLKMVERPEPVPGPGEVLIELGAASLNYRDMLMVAGRYNPNIKLPLVPLSDGAGTVLETGSEVRSLQKGDRVACVFTPDWESGLPEKAALRATLGGPLDGTLRERMALPEKGLVKIPDHLSFEEAAALPCAGLTAWSALVTYGTGYREHNGAERGIAPPDPVESLKGQWVLVQGTGGVSIFALQMARLLGARVIATSGEDEKMERLRELGAEHVINYNTTPDWDQKALEITERRGVDNVIEVGGAGTLERSIRAVRPGGLISLIGVLAGGAKDLNLLPAIMRNIRIQGILVGHRQGFLAMNQFVGAHTMRPIIDRVFPFEEAPEALRYLKSGRHFGKICITFNT